MVIVNNFYFLRDASVAQVSENTRNSNCETLTVQFDGTATSFAAQILGSVDLASDTYYPLTGFDTTFNDVQTLTTKGIYTFGIEGIAKFKLNLTEISGGSISAFAKMTKGV